jgi:hypothetical protein
VQNDENAYTSDSTAENQNESLTAKTRDPTTPDPIMATPLPIAMPSLLRLGENIRLAIIIMVSESNPTVSAEKMPLSILHASEIYSLLGEKSVATFDANIHTGLPGGCPDSSLYAATIYSGQSQ